MIHIQQVTVIPSENLNQFNSLRDSGTEWDDSEGKRFLQNFNNALFLAYNDTNVVGFLTAYKLQRLDKKKAEVLIYEVAVDPTFQKQGIGKALMEKVLTWAKEQEAGEAWVLTNQSNTVAMALYKSVGGTIEATDEQMVTFAIESNT